MSFAAYSPNTTDQATPEIMALAGPTFIAHTKDSLWSIDLFRCESILLRSHWVLVIMDIFTRRIVGFGVERARISTASRYVGCSITPSLATSYRSTSAPITFRFHRWLANLRVLKIEEIKSVPYTPVSHPLIERLIGTIRREFLDRVFFWNVTDLARKLAEFTDYYNAHRVHRSLGGTTPTQCAGAPPAARAPLNQYAWRPHCRGLFQTPVAA